MKWTAGISKRNPAREGSGSRPFLQPLAVAVVGVALVCLALLTGLMDLRALDHTLMKYIERSGLVLVADIQKASTHYFDLLQHRPPPRLDDFGLPDGDEPSFSLREIMIVRLMDLIRNLDRVLGDGPLDGAQLKHFADKESLWLLAIFDSRGDLLFSSRPVPPSIRHKAAPVIQGETRVLIDLFGGGRGPEDRQNTEWMAIRTKWREGSVLVALDPDASLFWRLKTAVQQAIDEVGLGGETGFLMVTDEKGRRLGSMGRTPEDGADIIAPDHEGFRPEGIESRKVQLGEEKLLEISAPIRFQKGLSGVVRVGLSRESAEAMLSKEKGRGILWMSFMGVITLLSMWLLYKNQNRHLKRMREVEDRLNQARRLSAMGRMAAGVAHEIRNPLNAIGMASQRLSEKNVDQLSGVIRNEIRRLDQIIDDFLSLSRGRTTAYRPHDIKALMDQMALLLREESLSRGVRMVCDWEDGPLLVSMDVDRMTQAIMNIVKNAVESISDEGIVTLSVEQESKDWVRIGVRDNGKGLGPEEMDRMFNPDYTTKEKGLGLGLPLANEIIRGHGGEIRVMSEPDKGTTVIIRLPLARIE